jgi:UDP-N-acetylmuramyl pentapeptide phosphotransferase/UDP-N-acetylglucosamine-1-phosphate transferase
LDAIITNLGIINFSEIPYGFAIALAFTVFALTGMSNAYNMIDGFNGLSSLVGVITFAALAYISFNFSDWPIINISLAFIGAILGFFIWNYPRGSIFLGDGGAYLIGYGIGLQTILLISRHPEISPWFAILVNAYPIFEALFTIYRRLIHQRKNPGNADGIHLHSLIFRRILNRKITTCRSDFFNANSRTSPYLWILASLPIIPALFFFKSSIILISFIILFMITYLYLYSKIVRFETPSWLKASRFP